ncbi:hypothetical protein [Loktanella salsilacus]|uniref:hypothetical protein n=1 Tax=Loktanella salsilacus TaxID=195913 RepID=UPI0020B68C19|nr:hypothetical protein [Loktanella salsilacus]UTH44503.1 hypothetical protein KBK07_15795 [Loktanella salsilacus]
MKFICIVAIPMDPELKNSRDDQLTIQLRVDASGKPSPKGHSFGWRGIPTHNEDVFPFIMKANGQLDFGKYDEAIDRFGGIDLLEKDRVSVGVNFVFTENEEDMNYIIKTVETIVTGAST